MTPENRAVINGKKIEEYFWGRKVVVYVDGHAVEDSFKEACEKARHGSPLSWEGGLSPEMQKRGYK